MKKDNSTFRLKTLLRGNLLKEINAPVVMEAFGGYGRLWSRCYSHVEDGVVFEKNPKKTAVLARDRPGWSVYETDCVYAIREGIGSHLAVNFFDLDAWGDPWPAIEALFESTRPWPNTIGIVVTDGLRQGLRMNGGWNIQSMAEMVEKHGNQSLHDHYLDICKEMLTEKAGAIGYNLRRWAGYYCGHQKQMTHYAAVLVSGRIAAGPS